MACVPESPTIRQRVRAVLAPIPGAVALARLVVETVRVVFRYRATGLAAEAAFFSLLSLPPLLLSMVAGVGFTSGWVGSANLGRMRDLLEDWALRFLTPETVDEVIMPTFDETLAQGRADLLSLGFVIALWSGSRALHVLLEAICIMYGQGGDRGPVRARVVSLTSYLLSILVLGFLLPLLLIGPGVLRRLLPEDMGPIVGLYWPVLALLGILVLNGLYHFATPQRSPFFRDLPGALLAAVLWTVLSVLIRLWADRAVGGTAVFGPLTAPIILMMWLWAMSSAVLVGAALNAAIRRLWPPPEWRGPRVRASEWWEERRAVREAQEDDDSADEEERGMDGVPGPR